MTRPPAPEPAVLVLADGSLFEGEAIGATPSGANTTSGEVVFNTSMTGYQEIITDPSYAGQIITFTSTHIGNYGTTAADDESRRPFCRGVVVRDLARRHSNWRATGDLDSYLRAHGVAGIAGVDTRRLTRHLRDHGAVPGAFGTDEVAVKAAAADSVGTDGCDLVAEVTCDSPYEVGSGRWRVVAYDFGIKASILSELSRLATVEVVPASTPASEVLARGPHGVFLSNGPGDPAAVGYAATAIAGLVGELPVFGICLGHQLLASAVGAATYKLPFGHHGGNHPVRDLATGRIEITSQNHNYAVHADSLGDAEVSHVNLNDGVVEGLVIPGQDAFSVQYHPEAGPGPHDARHLFARFEAILEERHRAPS